ncbi:MULTISPECIES: FAD-binding protein [Pseudomonas]|uniref:FAD-binding protein n=3 Tax=Pseudomonas TaxID=286 RepID=A0A2R7UHF7_PSEDL|nr:MULTISPECIES: FAD-binding protein [Pseudomonas]MRF40570.1 FAD-binding protein [Escherichia coli]MBF8644357.1 FAD-binding protein [Pseudomonas pudica]MBF8701360.1 FAD-binding protein [Pseudomonas putida]MBF8707873.1 FAD-binding protein [Pseudomonas putida]MBF8735134.1 FAD-binding protein [Pseudomonas putida]
MNSAVTAILEPLQVADAADLQWQAQCDVLVIGWGAAGACAALQARAEGADVLVADRFTGGGASARSGGVVYAGGGTRHQQAAGFDDSPEAMFDYLRHETQGVVSDETLWRFCRDSVANLQWLESHGVPFAHQMPPGGKTSYPPDGAFLYYSGNELVPAYTGQRAAAPRGHRTVGKGQCGAVLYSHLQAACLRAGVRPLPQSAARRLVLDGQGRVIGAELWRLPPGSQVACKHARLAARAERLQNFMPGYCERLRRRLSALEHKHARPWLVRAVHGVVLSTGGFIFNRELIKAHAPAFRRNFKVGATGCDGSGLRLGLSVGAASDRLQRVSAWRFINPPYSWHKGIVVNRAGERFCNEEVYGATLGQPLMEEQGGQAWLVLDAPLRKQALREALFGGYWWFQALPALVLMLLGARKGKSLQQLAQATGMGAQSLRQALLANNAAARGQAPDPFGKSAAGRQVLEQGPFYACDISVGNPIFPLGALTLGGLRVDEGSGAVVDCDGQAIGGLFAAGRTALGIPSHLYISGLSLADCVFSGRRAGAAVVHGARLNTDCEVGS